MVLSELQIPLEGTTALPSLCYVTEYRCGNKILETKELASLCIRLEETQPSLTFSKNTNSALHSSRRNRGTAQWVACGTTTKQKLQFAVQKTTHIVPLYMHIPKQRGKHLTSLPVCMDLGAVEVWDGVF